MKLLRSGSDHAEPAIEPDVVEVSAGKGRPTPKRRESAPKRQPVSAPKNTKEANARARQLNRQARTAGGTKMTTKQYREAVRRGDPSALPRRDRGPVRKLARDWVDSRRMASNYMMLLFIPMLLAPLFGRPVISYIADGLVLVFVLCLGVEWYRTGSRVIALARSRGVETIEKPLVIGFYAGSRAWLPRRFRLPKPVYQLGDEV